MIVMNIGDDDHQMMAMMMTKIVKGKMIGLISKIVFEIPMVDASVMAAFCPRKKGSQSVNSNNQRMVT